jgi:hypothetical protein
MHRLLPNGTDISRMTVAQIDAARTKAERNFVTDALDARRALGETIAARALLGVFAGGVVGGLVGFGFGFIIAAFSIVGFIVTCFIAGNRRYVRESDHVRRRAF